MTGDRNFILRPPKRPAGASKGKNALALRREALINAWSDHVLDEHFWGQRYTDTPADPEGQRKCGACEEHLTWIKESEKWR